jgi:hypothetical protein
MELMQRLPRVLPSADPDLAQRKLESCGAEHPAHRREIIVAKIVCISLLRTGMCVEAQPPFPLLPLDRLLAKHGDPS